MTSAQQDSSVNRLSGTKKDFECRRFLPSVEVLLSQYYVDWTRQGGVSVSAKNGSQNTFQRI